VITFLSACPRLAGTRVLSCVQVDDIHLLARSKSVTGSQLWKQRVMSGAEAANGRGHPYSRSTKEGDKIDPLRLL